MESVAAERLTKIGKNPSLVSSRADLEEDQKLVNEIVMESTPVVTSASEDNDSDDSSESSKSSKRKKKFKFDFTGKLQRITEERKSKSRESLHDLGMSNGRFYNRMKKAPSGPNLFGLRVPTLPDRKRSGSVGDELNKLQGSGARSTEHPRGSEGTIIPKDELITGEELKRSTSLDRPIVRTSDKHSKVKSRDQTQSVGETPTSENKGMMHYLKIPIKKSEQKTKQKGVKSEGLHRRRSMGDGEEQPSVRPSNLSIVSDSSLHHANTCATLSDLRREKTPKSQGYTKEKHKQPPKSAIHELVSCIAPSARSVIPNKSEPVKQQTSSEQVKKILEISVSEPAKPSSGIDKYDTTKPTLIKDTTIVIESDIPSDSKYESSRL